MLKHSRWAAYGWAAPCSLVGLLLARLAARDLPMAENRPRGRPDGHGPSATAMFRQLAVYAAPILNGAKRVDLPIELPNRFERVIKLKTARAIGITIPQALLLRADEVIE